jgi:hypothetical protein
MGRGGYHIFPFLPSCRSPACLAWMFVVLFHFSCLAEPWEHMSPGVMFGTYSNWPRSVIMFAREPDVQAVITPNVGGRIVHYSMRGKNVLLDRPITGTNQMFHVGGYQCDVGPEILELPLHPTLSIGKNGWQHKPYTVRVLSDPDETLGVKIEKEILLDRESGAIALTQRMKNTSKTNVTYCLWDRTACQPGGFALMPLNKNSRFKDGWSLHNVYNGAFVFDGEKYVSLHVREIDDVLVVYCDSEPTKIGADSDADWIAYVYEDLLFVKQYPFDPTAKYSDGGNSIELYFDRDVAELQVVSPETNLEPEQNYSFPEKWTLIRLDKPVMDFEDARKAVKKIPRSPFKR